MTGSAVSECMKMFDLMPMLLMVSCTPLHTIVRTLEPLNHGTGNDDDLILMYCSPRRAAFSIIVMTRGMLFSTIASIRSLDIDRILSINPSQAGCTVDVPITLSNAKFGLTSYGSNDLWHRGHLQTEHLLTHALWNVWPHGSTPVRPVSGDRHIEHSMS